MGFFLLQASARPRQRHESVAPQTRFPPRERGRNEGSFPVSRERENRPAELRPGKAAERRRLRRFGVGHFFAPLQTMTAIRHERGLLSSEMVVGLANATLDHDIPAGVYLSRL